MTREILRLAGAVVMAIVVFVVVTWALTVSFVSSSQNLDWFHLAFAIGSFAALLTGLTLLPRD